MSTGIRGKLAYGFGLLLFLVIFSLLRPTPTQAAINAQINFQGKLTNPDGTNVSDGTYSIRFRIYNNSTADAANPCAANSCQWEETQASVAVSAGIFQVNLGSVTSLPGSVDFNTSGLYLGVKVGGDAEMTPRILFTATPYAFNSNTLGGIGAAGFIQLSPGAQQTGTLNISGTATIGNSLLFSSAVANTIQGAASQTLSVDSGSSGSLALGTGNASSLTLGKFGVPITSAGGLTVNSGSNVPTTDQVVIDNTSSTGVATAGVNGLSVRFKGGSAAVEASGIRIDYTPGGTSGGTWSGMRIVESSAPASGVNSYGLKLEGIGSGAGTSYGIGVASGWDIGIDVQSGGLQLAASAADPATPAAGNLRFYAKDVAGRLLPKWVGPSGVDTPVQANLGFNRVAWTNPSGGTNLTTCITAVGSAFTNVGTVANPTPASTNLLTSARRTTFSTGGTAGALASHRQGTLQVWRGNTAGLGGFFYTTRFGTSTLATGNRAFVGLSSSTAAPTNIDPTTSATIGRVGMVINASTGNWNIATNAVGVAPSVTSLGANFPVNNSSMYELVLFSAPNGSSIGYRVTNISTGNVTSGTLSSNLPTSTTFLAPQFWITNNTTASAAIIDFAGWYLESDN